jgi:hypothetical protein
VRPTDPLGIELEPPDSAGERHGSRRPPRTSAGSQAALVRDGCGLAVVDAVTDRYCLLTVNASRLANRRA